jgi:hypothetical protein
MVSKVESGVINLQGVLLLIKVVFLIVWRDCLGKLTEWTCSSGLNHTCVLRNVKSRSVLYWTNGVLRDFFEIVSLKSVSDRNRVISFSKRLSRRQQPKSCTA